MPKSNVSSGDKTQAVAASQRDARTTFQIITIYSFSKGRMFNKWYYLINRLSYHNFWPSIYQITCSIFSCIANVGGVLCSSRMRCYGYNVNKPCAFWLAPGDIIRDCGRGFVSKNDCLETDAYYCGLSQRCLVRGL